MAGMSMTRIPRRPWTPEEAERFRQDWLALIPLITLCEKYQRTRNSLVGQASRMKLPKRQQMTRDYELVDRK